MPGLVPRIALPVLAVGAAVALAACGSSSSADSASDTTPSSTAAAVKAPAKPVPPAMQSAHSGAKLSVLSPTKGDVVTSNALTADVQLDDFKIDCRFAGTPNQDGIGHYHVMLDGKLIDMFCKDRATVSLQNVPAGPHELEVVPAVNDHTDDLPQEKKISFTYKPADPAAEIKAVANPGTPAVTVVSPKSGATVSGGFDFVIEPKNLRLSCALYGKNNLAGYGHWHANVDSTKKGMMGMATMLGMSCRRSFHVSLAGIAPGKHTFFAILEDNQHAPTPAATASVSLNVR